MNIEFTTIIPILGALIVLPLVIYALVAYHKTPFMASLCMVIGVFLSGVSLGMSLTLFT